MHIESSSTGDTASKADSAAELAIVHPVPPARRRKKQPAPAIPTTRSATANTSTSAPPSTESAVQPVPPVLRQLQHRPIAGLQRAHPTAYERLHTALLPHWSRLAEQHMHFTSADVQQRIPMLAQRFDLNEAQVLLAWWGDQLNHTLTELFVLCARAGLVEAMRAIRHLVPEEYYGLMPAVVGDGAVNGNPAVSDRTPIEAARKTSNGPPPPAGTSNEDNATKPPHPQHQTTIPPTDALKSPNGATIFDRLGVPRIAFDELVAATRSWSPHNVLGAGGFGTVYHGRWKNTLVAIKRIKSSATTAAATPANAAAARLEEQQGLNELWHLNSCRHDNILPLYGFSLEPNGEPCLVYKMMTGGSLEYRLSVGRGAATTATAAGSGGRAPLLWLERMRIAIGTARGLQYLHTLNKVPIIHGDIKPANILLDDCCEPKIGDFGLTRVGADDDADVPVSRVYGTRPYLPAEFLTEKALSTKVDTYSFGVVLLELATGLRAYHRSYGFLHRYTRQFDEASGFQLMPQLLPPPASNSDAGADVEQSRFTFCVLMHLGRQCTEALAVRRPEMVRVMTSLEGMAVRQSGGTGDGL